MSSPQKGDPLYKKPCPKCKSSDANQVFSYDNKPNDSWCFACETYFPSDDSLDKVVPIKQQYNKVSTMEIEDIKKLPIRALEDRKIRKETCAASKDNMLRERVLKASTARTMQDLLPCHIQQLLQGGWEPPAAGWRWWW